MEAAGDHEVQHEPEVLAWCGFETDGDAFADASQFAHGAAVHGSEWWIDGTEKEDRTQAHLFEWLIEDARFQRGDVGGDVGEFRHSIQLAAVGFGSQQGLLDAITRGWCYR